MKKPITLCLLLFCFLYCGTKLGEEEIGLSNAEGIEEIYPLLNINNPSTIVMDGQRVYIEDGSTVKVFERSDFKYIRTIGREGQGPGEFQDSATPQILPGKLLVSSSNRISFFTLSGEFIEDKKHTYYGTTLKTVNNKYVGYDWVFEEDYVAYYLYDSDFKPIKELHRGKAIRHPNGRRNLFEIFFYDTYKDKIVVAHREGFFIDVFDSEGNIIFSIKHEVKSVPFTDEDREKVIQYWKEDRRYEQWQIESLEKSTNFPDFYPPIHTCRLADGKIFVITYEKRDSKFECLIFNLEGKYIKNTYIPLNMLAPNLASPFTIYGSNLYQLIYSMGDDGWKLHVNPI